MTSQIENNTQLIDPKTYKPKSCMIFSAPINKKTQKNNKKSIGYKMINITTLNDDGTIGKLILPTERLFSFGMTVTEYNDEPTGYSFPLCLWNRDGATEGEKKWISKFNKIVDNCVNHLIKVRDDIDYEDLEKKDLKKFNPLWWKKEVVRNKQGKKVLQEDKTQGPTLYPKVDYSKKDNCFYTPFYDMKGNEIKPKSLIKTHCYAESTIRIDAIHIGNGISLQFRLNDAAIELLQPKGKNRRFVRRPKAEPLVQVDDEAVDEVVDEAVASKDIGKKRKAKVLYTDEEEEDKKEPIIKVFASESEAEEENERVAVECDEQEKEYSEYLEAGAETDSEDEAGGESGAEEFFSE